MIVCQANIYPFTSLVLSPKATKKASQMQPKFGSMHYAKLLFNLYLQLMEINYYYYIKLRDGDN